MLTTVSSGTVFTMMQLVQFFFFFSSVMAAKENKTLRDVLTNLLTQ